jgi:hypothetical protein
MYEEADHNAVIDYITQSLVAGKVSCHGMVLLLLFHHNSVGLLLAVKRFSNGLMLPLNSETLLCGSRVV